MEPLTIALLVLLLVVAVIVGLAALRRSASPPDNSLALLQQLEALRTDLRESFGQQSQSVHRQLTAMEQRIQHATGQIGNHLGELSKATQQVYTVGKDIASLQEILKAPKLRGVLGELFLGDLLGQILPPNHFTLQHRFKSGETVDAVVRLGQGMVPIDSKFPLENFRRLIESPSDDERKNARRKFIADVKKHVDAIERKYILPDEGTFPFALMYIPAENVYYETIIKDESDDEKSLSAYALARKVIPVSPNSLYAYLQAIVMGLKGLQIEKSAQYIIAQLAALQGDLKKFTDLFQIVGGHLTNARGRYDEAARQLDQLSGKVALADRTTLPPHDDRAAIP